MIWVDCAISAWGNFDFRNWAFRACIHWWFGNVYLFYTIFCCLSLKLWIVPASSLAGGHQIIYVWIKDSTAQKKRSGIMCPSQQDPKSVHTTKCFERENDKGYKLTVGRITHLFILITDNVSQRLNTSVYIWPHQPKLKWNRLKHSLFKHNM